MATYSFALKSTCAALSILVGMTSVTYAGDPTLEHARDLTELSLEDLMEVKVTSVSKRDQVAGEVSAALFVLNHEDIHRSGATSIPELLRLVPGLHVAQIDTSRWAISARGSNSLFANRLLVLIDGRSVYSPLFSGVYWDAQDTRIEDIERIEVIRGPGASVWGANAVNGVINIITKSALETTSSEIVGGVGSEENGMVNMRYGERLSDSSAGRIYGKYFKRDRSAQIAGVDAYDQWDAGQGGGRFDYHEDRDAVTVQGDFYKGRVGLQGTPLSPYTFVLTDIDRTTDYDGNNILVNWNHRLDAKQELTVKTYFDKTARDAVSLKERYQTFDAEAQYLLPLTPDNDLMFGVNYRRVTDFIGNSPYLEFASPHSTTELYSGYVQDEVKLLENRLRITLGSKIETNTYTGFEYQPTVRVAWVPAPSHTLWTAFSRAVRTPSRVQEDSKLILANLPDQNFQPFPLYLVGSKDGNSEVLKAYEIGYRAAPWSNYTFDIATFYNDYDNLVSITNSPITLGPDGRPELLSNFANGDTGRAYGIEALNTWRPTSDWTLQAWYSWLNFDQKQGDSDLDLGGPTRSDPHNQAFLRSLVSLPGDFTFDSYLRYVDSVPSYDVDAYIDLTLRLGWHLNKSIEFAVTGNNLLHNSHREYIPDSIQIAPADIQRSVIGTVTVRF